jgi:hypothetical protein
MFSGITTHRECQSRIITLMIGECSLKINNLIREKSERERANFILRFDTTEIAATRVKAFSQLSHILRGRQRHYRILASTFRCSAAFETLFDTELQA